MLSIERSGYYVWLKRKPSKRQQSNKMLDEKIVDIFKRHKSRYGSPRITGDLHDSNEICSKNRVARRMKHLGLKAKAKKKFKVTTDSKHNLPVAPNLLNRDFTAQAPNEQYKMKISKSEIEKLSTPLPLKQGVTEQKRYYDDTLKGFGIRITSKGTKSFFIEKLIKGKLRRITIGRCPPLTAAAARIEATKLLGQIATGIDPQAEKRVTKMRQVTLGEVFFDYLKARKSLKPKTLYDYNRIINIAF
jgi:hypothetical protein